MKVFNTRRLVEYSLESGTIIVEVKSEGGMEPAAPGVVKKAKK